MAIDSIEIKSEDDLWVLLQGLLDGSVEGRPAVKISGWRPELLYFPDEPTGHTVSPAAAKAITNVHGSLCRGYALLAYGAADMRLLSVEDQRLLDIRFLITDGSSGVELEDKIIEAVVMGLIAKMTGDQITITIVIFLVLYFSSSFGRYWISQAYEARKQDRTAGEREKLSEEETKRAQILADALTKKSDLEGLRLASIEVKKDLVSAARSFDRSRVLGADLTSEEARVILSKDREKSVGRRIDGEYDVARIVTEQDAPFGFRLKNLKTGEEFDARADEGEIPSEDIHSLFQAAEHRTSVFVSVNGRYVGDRLASANIVRVTPLNGGSPDDNDSN